MLNTEVDNYANMDDDAFEALLDGTESTSNEESLNEAPEPIEEDAVEESEDDTTDDTEDETEEEETESDEESEEESTLDASDTSDEDTDETTDVAPLTSGELEELYKPFKASGREVSVKSIEEARKLMSMGVDYSNKLQGFKTHRKTIKTLESNKIDADQLNYLIDLSKGNPKAIAKLIKDSGVDPLDFGTEEDSSYKPSDYSVSDNEINLNEALSRIEDTPSFNETSSIIADQWDDASRKALFASDDLPDILENLNSHVANGTYKRVMQEVDRARLFDSRLRGLSDLEAYNEVGLRLRSQESTDVPAKKVIVKTAPKQAVDNNQDRKLRAKSSKSSPTPKRAPVNWANVSDEEFEKQLKGE